MKQSVNLYLASVVSKGKGFWLINFTDEEDIHNSLGAKLLECYRKELFGLDGAIEVKYAINTTLDILTFDSKFNQYKLDNSDTVYSSEIPLGLIEDIFDLWTNSYKNKIMWKKYIGLLNFRKKIKTNNNYINLGLKGDIYEFSVKLDELLSLKSSICSFRRNKSKESMW